MKILIIDDNLERIKIFINALGKFSPDFVDNSAEAIERLEKEVYDIILLDDDLEDGGSGADVAVYLFDNDNNPNVEAEIILDGTDKKSVEAMLYKLAPVCSNVHYIGFGKEIFEYFGLTFKKEWL